ncbi:hypothetical protein [uncultured Turicimonas sp.]|uniref:hypothetical protein n=1 Tax=uncultured Turicimonas sp. TaxID=1918607 RepID=UPI003211BFCB
MKKIINGFLTVFLIFACQNVLAEPFKIYGADFTRDEKGSEFYEKTIVAIVKAVYPREVSTYSTDWRGLDHAISHKEADLVIPGAAAYNGENNNLNNFERAILKGSRTKARRNKGERYKKISRL